MNKNGLTYSKNKYKMHFQNLASPSFSNPTQLFSNNYTPFDVCYFFSFCMSCLWLIGKSGWAHFYLSIVLLST